MKKLSSVWLLVSLWNKIKMKFVIFGYFLTLALVAEASVSMHNEFYCYATDLIRPLNEMHATLTSYEAVRRPADLPVSSKMIR